MRQEAQQHEHRPEQRVQEELDRPRTRGSAEPQIPIRKYIGTSTSSQNTKNRIRSNAMNVPAIPVSSSSISARNAFVPPGSGTYRQV